MESGTDGVDLRAYFPFGPALLYVHSGHGTAIEDTQTITRVDTGLGPFAFAGGPVSEADARRERRLLRALLEHALDQLNEEGE